MNTKTFPAFAFAPPYGGKTPEEIAAGDLGRVYLTVDAKPVGLGYSLIGKCSVTVELPGLQGLVENKLAALKADLEKTRAENHQRVLHIESEIQQLLAIAG